MRDQFYNGKRYKDGKVPYCKECKECERMRGLPEIENPRVDLQESAIKTNAKTLQHQTRSRI